MTAATTAPDPPPSPARSSRSATAPRPRRPRAVPLAAVVLLAASCSRCRAPLAWARPASADRRTTAATLPRKARRSPTPTTTPAG